MKDEKIINEIATAFRNKIGTLFIGSGISKKSELPLWDDLLKPDAAELGLELGTNENLPQIAQWIVNSNAGNRGHLINQIRSALRKNTGPNKYHTALIHTIVDEIWTTNYDTLLEEAFSSFTVAVRANDASISHPADWAEIEIIKMHGSIDSNHEDIVITKEDYEDFFYKRPATAQRLRNDLLSRTFLFVGYGFGDPDIENILVEARRLAHKATRKHHLITKRLNKTDDGEQLVIRQELWANDLKRIGIKCTLIDDYDELQNILDEIALRSRGSSIYITGSHTKTNETAKEIGRQLASLTEPEVTVIDGQSTGLSRDAITAFMEECVIKKYDLRNRLRIHPNPYAANPEFSNNEELLPTLKNWRRTLLRETQVVIAFDGGMGTDMEVELALSLGCRVIPVPTEKRKIEDLLKNSAVVKGMQTTCPHYLDKLKSESTILASDVIDCVKQLLK